MERDCLEGNNTRPIPQCNPIGEQGLSAAINWREVRINKVANGFIVIVGCKTLVAKEWSEIVLGLEEYWSNPHVAEKKYCK